MENQRLKEITRATESCAGGSDAPTLTQFDFILVWLETGEVPRAEQRYNSILLSKTALFALGRNQSHTCTCY